VGRERKKELDYKEGSPNRNEVLRSDGGKSVVVHRRRGCRALSIKNDGELFKRRKKKSDPESKSRSALLHRGRFAEGRGEGVGGGGKVRWKLLASHQ